ncbi:MAG: hypothetical protein ACRDKE_01000, partial [Solirubrobacterales bacterium]
LIASGTMIPHLAGTSQAYGDYANAPAIAAVLEADADGDGFGDETQDSCPTHADLQVACPGPTVSLLKSGTQKYSKLALTHSVAAAATVASYASVKVGKKTYKSRTTTKSLAAGSAAVFKLSFASSAKTAIAKYLKTHKSLKATVNASVSNAFGSSTASITVKLSK